MAQARIGNTDQLQGSAVTAVIAGGPRRRLHAGGRLCQLCGERRARFSYRGVVKADRAHTLCFECYRAQRNQLRARWLGVLRPAPDALSSSKGEGAWLAPLASPPPPASKMLGDRPALYAGLRLRLRRAQITARHALALAAETPVATAFAS